METRTTAEEHLPADDQQALLVLPDLLHAIFRMRDAQSLQLTTVMVDGKPLSVWRHCAYTKAIDMALARLPASMLPGDRPHPRQTADMKKMVCSECGSADVRLDAYASWDIDRQEWVLASTFDNGICEKCAELGSGETNIEEQALIGCQHGEHEDCMTCAICGECREDLDEDDVCGDCRGESDDDEPVDGRPMVAGDIA